MMDYKYMIHRMLRRSRYPVPMARLCEELEVSESTVQRTLREMRLHMDAPIVRTRNPLGYRYSDEAFELPGLWFLKQEIRAMALLIQLLKTLHPDLFGEDLAPLEKKYGDFLKADGVNFDLGKRIRLRRSAARPVGHAFDKVSTALLDWRRIALHYAARSTGIVTEREVSPQRYVYYRDNWYIDCWCHKRNELRRLAVDRIEKPVVLDTPADEIEEQVLNSQLDDGYGIISGPALHKAVLRFTPGRTPWISSEIWHPDQAGRVLETGEYLLEFPYSQPDELILDIMRYGPDVEVLAPLELREAVAERHRAAYAQYLKK